MEGGRMRAERLCPGHTGVADFELRVHGVVQWFGAMNK